MKLSCPVCNTVFPVEAGIQDARAREAVAAALLLPSPLGDRILPYLGLFRPVSRALAWDRVARLLGELADGIASGKLERNGRTWSAPLEYWAAALDEILGKRDRLTLPLKSHGYLFEIVAGYSNKAEAAPERQSIERARHPAHRKIAVEETVGTDPQIQAAALDTLKHLTKGAR